MISLENSREGLCFKSMDSECHKIADWWVNNTVDHENGGFWGAIDNADNPNKKASKGIILNTRILWFFSEAARHYSDASYLEMAKRAYHYLTEHFDDTVHGGVIWELDFTGGPISGKKQTYAQAFAIYSLAAYYRCSNDDNALAKALSYFDLIESKTIDLKYGGYLEAFSQNWDYIEDVRLSQKDKNLPKSMNTHIHILEAYTGLYRASDNSRVANSLKNLLVLICDTILDNQTYHLRLFQNMDWSDMSESYSYGHDIECSWLIWDAVTALGDPTLMERYKPTVLKMAEICLEQSLGDLGQVCDQYTFVDKKKHIESEWWVQAEALVGFLNAYQLTGKTEYFSACEKIWRFTQEQHIDFTNGEWSWFAKRDRTKDNEMYKAGFWKGPYHNGRAMMEASELLKTFSSYSGGKIHAMAN